VFSRISLLLSEVQLQAPHYRAVATADICHPPVAAAVYRARFSLFRIALGKGSKAQRLKDPTAFSRLRPRNVSGDRSGVRYACVPLQSGSTGPKNRALYYLLAKMPKHHLTASRTLKTTTWCAWKDAGRNSGSKIVAPQRKTPPPFLGDGV